MLDAANDGFLALLVDMTSDRKCRCFALPSILNDGFRLLALDTCGDKWLGDGANDFKRAGVRTSAAAMARLLRDSDDALVLTPGTVRNGCLGELIGSISEGSGLALGAK